MAIAWLLVVVGIVGLVWSADRFVAGSAALAKNFGVSKMVIGLTVVSFGTSSPEILVSLNAALEGSPEMAIGNALGSNIANVGLVLAITALIAAIPIQRHLLTQEIPALLLITAVAGVFLYDGQLQRWEGWFLLLFTIPLIYVMLRVKRQHPDEIIEEEIPDLGTGIAILWFIIGLAILAISARALVTGAETIALNLGISKLVVGLTVVAIGTSLPELAASVMSAIKGHHDIALGNVVGSNIFNILTVMSVPGIVGMSTIGDSVFYRDYVATALITAFLCFIIWLEFFWSRRRGKPASLGRIVGFLLLAGYISYSVILFNTATS